MTRKRNRGRVCICLPNWFVFSKTVFFIWGLILSHAVVEYTVVNVLMDYLTDAWKGPSLREAAMVVNLFEGVKAVSVVAVMHISDAYTAPFNMLILCTAAYSTVSSASPLYESTLPPAPLGIGGSGSLQYRWIGFNPMGLMLLWVTSKSLDANLKTFFSALLLIALGGAAKDPILKDFLDYQLSQKVKKENEETSNKIATNGDEDKELSEGNRGKSTFWWSTASITGTVISVFWVAQTSWRTIFKISSLLMGAMYVLFYSGFLCYYPEERPTGSPLITIYRVFKAAIKKRHLPYPRSEADYYNPNNPNIKELFYRREDREHEVHLLPRVPSILLFFDKAAIIGNRSDAEREERNGELCRVEQVREVKILYPIVQLGFLFFAYTLVSASGKTYFVEQASNLDPNIGDFQVPIMVFFALKSVTSVVVNFIQTSGRHIKLLWIRALFEFIQTRVSTIRSIAIGMFCAVACSIAAWQVELRRLSLINQYRVLESQDPDNATISLSIMVLAPQYFLLGLMEGSGEKALAKFAEDHVAKSMKKYVEPCIGIMLLMGKICSIICVLIFRSWFKESLNTSHLDRYFLMLAILSFIFFCIYVYYYCDGLREEFGIFVYHYNRIREVFGIFVYYIYGLRHKSTQIEGSNKEGRTSSNDAAEDVQKEKELELGTSTTADSTVLKPEIQDKLSRQWSRKRSNKRTSRTD